MFNAPYEFHLLGKDWTMQPDPITRRLFKFKAKFRTYFVTIEEFSFGVAAIKYCDEKDMDAKNAYEKIFNDGDAIRVITTCVHIMLDYWRRNPDTSFAFYAIPRKANLSARNVKDRLEEYKAVRFRIYNYAMLALFTSNFSISRDSKNYIYVLINKSDKKPGLTIKNIGNYLIKNRETIFELDSD